ncbi:tumor necrosis factor b (TNF superfamily, member 2) [Conger conger]|uniref:tumor necrosis factor b (TNF superfamily, member 2) n=1 Tax=Conger conger TaxID=82655 RepID=UPI002A5A01B5|nr:tumor necrosis factor b (TNF superfamily, member 2) [Conger conger]
MDGYTAALTGMESGERGPGPQLPGKPWGARVWKLCGALALLALCGVAALLFLCHSQTQAHGIENNEHQQHLKHISTNVRAAIHLHGEFNPEVRNSSVLWRDGDGHSFFQGGLRLVNNEIIIPQNGLYFVYSQVSFRVLCSSSGGHTNRPISHTIMRWSDAYNDRKPLLSAIRTTCQRDAESNGRSKSWYNAVYMGAVFSLEREDRLWTETNLLKDVDGEDEKTFFGVFAL